jgi:hypothetical protein
MLLFRLGILVTVLMAASTASAQSVEAFVTGGAGRWVHNTGSSGPLMVGAGGVEWLPTPHLGIAGETGLLTSTSGPVAISVSAEARLHFGNRSSTGAWAPYVFAGYSPLRFFELSDHGLQYGAGIDYRLTPRRAVRFELRDIVRDGGLVKSHYWTARVGMTFR